MENQEIDVPIESITMTKKITSFFQVTKSSKREKPSNIGGDIETSLGVTHRERNLESKDSTVVQQQDGEDGPSTTSTKRVKVASEADEVQQLLMYLNDSVHYIESNKADGTTSTTTTTTESWKAALQPHLESKHFQTLSKFVATERMKYIIYPPTPFIWSALNMCPLHNVKVVIVGQDPYHGPNQAHGLSFSVLPGCPIPPSLKNIYKELTEDPDISNFDTIPRHGHLIRWVQQGVLLLNAVMTVRDKEPNSHQNKGWEKVTDEIIRTVLMYHCCRSRESSDSSNVTLTSAEALSDITAKQATGTSKGQGCVFLLWGKPATTKAMNVIESVMNSNRSHHTTIHKQKTHAIICTSHPSPLGARKTSTPFLGSHCFSRCNQELISLGHDPIDWNV